MSSLDTSLSNEAALGRRVKALRKKSQLTLQQTSAITGVAISTLSKIENGQMSPTLDVILKLSNGLQTDINDLLTDKAATPPTGRKSIVRRGEGVVHQTDQHIYELRHTDLKQRRMHTAIVTLKARTTENFPQALNIRGEEFVYVLSGSVRVYLEHYEPVDLETGDSLYFDSPMGQAGISTSKKPAQVLWVYYEDK
ncbi:transcriptional regulator [Pseudomonas daroniae]|uniref:Transcriptional regulator n=1 Tax=Phytopseudomonas daroniae TaxID=2487519 RepID=A0A4Q9QS36_9GAMM|nr:MULTISPECIES: XRE family transcriptional regulator [Pseudomonas]TBU77232.1 transcriptional regulator [Pseudomonas daroniae]TBU83251.1 transcriptional regulator [Pseudomonas daroniae]TBU84890.1 transcriptional regulator [Pseudomonas sp. FRB 228]TBU93817.1 transcriptional regulator [Pseudomonas daroniae]